MNKQTEKAIIIEQFKQIEDENLIRAIKNMLDYALKKEKEKVKKPKPSDYRGCISKQTAKSLLNSVEESRKEWERNI